MSAAGSKGRRSPLELLHPDGVAAAALVLGDAIPPRLRPLAQEAHLVDLAVAAVDDVGAAAQRLAEDGVLFVAGSPRSARAAVVSAGLVAGPTILHLHGGGSRRFLVPLESVRHALDRLVPGVGWKGRTARVGVRVGAAPLLPLLTPAGVVGRPPGARPLFDWLRLEAGIEAAAPIVSYGDRPSLLVHSGGDQVAKLGPVAAEAETLRELGPAARAAGAHVPEPLRTGAVAGLPLLVETVLPGRPAASELRRGGAARYLGLVGGWLERWNSATAARRPLSEADLERAVLSPLATLDLPDAYVHRVRDLCARVTGRTVPLVAAHHDLTTANVLVGDGLGVVDWDTAEAAALPLTDFFYAVADARSAADGFADRAASFAAMFAADGTPAAEVAELQARLVSTLGLEPDVVELCFHACWLRHAANEAARADQMRPFGEIVRRVAAAT